MFPVHSDIWCKSDLRILLFQSGKISQIKIGNSRDSWILCHTLLSSLFPSISQFPKNIRNTFPGRPQKGIFLMSWRTGSDFIPGPLEFHLWDLSLCFQPWGIRGATQTHPALPGVGSWGFVAAIKHRNKKKEDYFPLVSDTGMEQSSTGWG